MRRFLNNFLPPLVVFIAVTLLAEVLIRVLRISPLQLPTPSAVAMRIHDRAGELGAATLNTATSAVLGFAFSAVAGVIIAVALSASGLIRRAFYPFTIFFQTVPIVAIAPAMVIWFDYSRTSVVLSAFIVSVFPVIANTLAGMLSTDPALVDMFRLYRAGRWATLWKLKLPAALPSILTGLRVAAGLAVIGTIVGEFVAAPGGENAPLGWVINEAGHNLRADVVFAGVLAASLLGLSLFGLVQLASYLLLRRWHASER